MNDKISTGLVITGISSISTPTFNPLTPSHAGTYTCEARIGGAVKAEKIMVTIREGEIPKSVHMYIIIMIETMTTRN